MMHKTWCPCCAFGCECETRGSRYYVPLPFYKAGEFHISGEEIACHQSIFFVMVKMMMLLEAVGVSGV